MNLKYSLVISIFITFLNAGSSEYGAPFITNYSPSDYSAYPQNWASVQDNRGVMYFGNNDGVLEYDGKNWRTIQVTNKSTVRSMAIDTNGSIYVGAQNEFGYLSPDNSGLLNYVSLSSELDSANTMFSDIWKVFCTSSGVFYCSKEILFLFNTDTIKSWKLENGSLFSFYVDNKLLIGHYTNGLMQLVGDSIVLVKNGRYFAEKNIFSILLYTEDNLLIATFENGLFTYSSSGGNAAPFYTDADEYIKNNQLYYGITLPNDGFAFGTLKNGCVIINRDGRINHFINKSIGLQDETVISLYNSSEINSNQLLWLSLNQGLSSVEINSPWRIWIEETGLDAAVYDIIRFNDVLYLATSLGVYYLNDAYSDPQFIKIEDLETQAWSFLKYNNVLFAGTTLGIYKISSKGAELFRESHYTYKLYASPSDSTKIYAGLGNGLAVIKYLDNKMEYHGKVNGIKDEVRSISEDNEGNLWIGTLVNGVYKLSFIQEKLLPLIQETDSDYPVQAIVEHFDMSDGLPSLKDINIYSFNDRILFATDKGIYKYNNSNDHFSPDLIFGEKYANGNSGVFRFIEDKNGDCWINLFSAKSEWIEHLVKQNDGSYISDPVPFRRLPQMSVQSFYNDENIMWIGGSEGLFSYNDEIKINYNQPYNTLIRKVVVEDDSLIFQGTNYNYQKNSDNVKKRITCLVQSEQQKPVLKYSYNHLTFHFSAPYFIKEGGTHYSYLLDGFDKRWSNWSSETKKEYTNIPEGNYIFRVKAQNVYKIKSSEAQFVFVILPPWYRTYWAYGIYLIFAVFFVWGVVRLNTHRLRIQKQRLEEIVRQRTAQIREQKEIIELEKDKSDRLLLNVLPAKVAEDLKQTGKTEPESFDDVTVYFSDVVGFTNMSTNLDPKYLIDELNEIFTAFDNIMERNFCERIKTIGDAYLAVCGMPVRNPDHPTNIINASIDIRDFLLGRNKDSELEWKIRIGVHTGQLVGGVVGIKKYIYDVFGDTINTASRMESNSEPMRINISETTFHLVKDKYTIIKRKPLHVKGKGKMNMYFVEK